MINKCPVCNKDLILDVEGNNKLNDEYSCSSEIEDGHNYFLHLNNKIIIFTTIKLLIDNLVFVLISNYDLNNTDILIEQYNLSDIFNCDMPCGYLHSQVIDKLFSDNEQLKYLDFLSKNHIFL